MARLWRRTADTRDGVSHSGSTAEGPGLEHSATPRPVLPHSEQCAPARPCWSTARSLANACPAPLVPVGKRGCTAQSRTAAMRSSEEPAVVRPARRRPLRSRIDLTPLDEVDAANALPGRRRRAGRFGLLWCPLVVGAPEVPRSRGCCWAKGSARRRASGARRG